MVANTQRRVVITCVGVVAANGIGEIIGYGQSNDAHGSMNPSSNGEQYARAIRLALEESNLSVHEIGYFSLDGRALPIADQSEAEALRIAFGSHLAQLPVSVPRTMLGHS